MKAIAIALLLGFALGDHLQLNYGSGVTFENTVDTFSLTITPMPADLKTAYDTADEIVTVSCFDDHDDGTGEVPHGSASGIQVSFLNQEILGIRKVFYSKWDGQIHNWWNHGMGGQSVPDYHNAVSEYNWGYADLSMTTCSYISSGDDHLRMDYGFVSTEFPEDLTMAVSSCYLHANVALNEGTIPSAGSSSEWWT